jgi:hypothetical protein
MSKILNYLDAAAGGTAPTDPVPLSVVLNLSNTGRNLWAALLETIKTAGKFVALDLSACTMGSTVFDPDYTNSDGKDKIASLVLPDLVTSIPSTYSNPAFEHFSSLISVTGKNVEIIGTWAFKGVEVGDRNLNGNTTPVYRRYALTMVNFPAATTIGDSAFDGCTSLTSMSLPASPPTLGTEVFRSTSDYYNNTTLTITVPSAAAVSAYESAWGVTANTAAGGNTAKYGNSHKAINIVAAP